MTEVGVNNIGSQRDTVNIDFSSHYTKMVLAGNTSFVFSNLPLNNKGTSIILDITQDSIGKHLLTWPATIIAVPFVNSDPDARTVMTLSTKDGGKNIEAHSHVENKIEIKEEDIEIHPSDTYGKLFVKIFGGQNNQKKEQLKQQILRDHEDAKKYQKLKDLTGSQILDKWIDYQQIVKRLEERIKIKKEERRVHTRCFMVHDIDIFLQKILEGKK